MKVLLAVDGSRYTKRMLAYVAAHEELFGQAYEYTAVAVTPEIPPHVRSYLDRAALDEYYASESRDVVDPVAAFFAQKKLPLTVLRLVGNAGDVIAETATQGDFDLIVMGSHGHSSIGSLVLGSVTARVLARCKTPLLVVR